MGTGGKLTWEDSVEERPAHGVTVETFQLDRLEVTLEEYARCVAEGKCPNPGSHAGCNWGQPSRNDHPINCVTWHAATQYCAWRGKRLPTEAEWEYAARGTQGRKYPWGAAELEQSTDPKLCWFRDNSAGTCPVGAYPAGTTPEGVLDLGGNVIEWVADRYCKYEKPSDCTAARAMRGCHYLDKKPYHCRGAHRAQLSPYDHAVTTGFRCAK